MSSVRAKFKCIENTQKTGDTAVSIYFDPVYSGSKENEQFYSATPGGRIELHVVNPIAAVSFKVGKDYYIDFTETGE